ncbi:MAG TPA: AAA family ATPase [Bacillota bacterium]|nr:AAA family ATPase [Bacillota bacterium]HOG52536.1 AAA family ATPase [Bacillota bacterium]
MILYRKLILEGFGCFAGRTEFTFAEGINTLSLLNEAGKSTMLNGLVHTLYGLQKAGKDRFRSWGGSKSFRGELTLCFKGDTYQISMDFDRDRVAVARFDEDTGKFTSFIREQSHVPAGNTSRDYLKFLQDLTGTVSVDVFRAAFVIDQPIKDDPELGKGWDLAAGEVGGAIGGAVEALMQRLGKNADFGITKYLKAFGESRDSYNDRILETKKGELASLEKARASAVESLNRVAPLVEELEKFEGKIRATKEEKEAARQRKARVGQWKQLRNRWESKNGEYALQKAEVGRIKGAEQERNRLAGELAALQASAKGLPVEDSRLEALRKASKEMIEEAAAAEALQRKYAGADGLGSEIAGLDIMREGAEADAAAICERASAEIERLKEAVRAKELWEGKYGGVAGISGPERRQMEERLAASQAAESKLARNAALIKNSPYAFAAVGAALGYFLWTRHADRGLSMGVAVAFALLGLIVRSLINVRIKKAASPGTDEDATLRERLRLLREMDAEPMPEVPQETGAKIHALESLVDDARALEKAASRVSSLLGMVSRDDMASAMELAGLNADVDEKALLRMDDGFWAAALKENGERAASYMGINDKERELESAEAVVATLMRGKSATIQELETSLAALEQQVQITMAEWMQGFKDDPFLKVSPDAATFAAAIEEEREAEEEENRLELQLEEEERGLERVRAALSEAKSGNPVNVPEIDERIETLKEEIEKLEDEVKAIAIAVRELKAAGEEYSSSSARILKGRITGLLEKVTGDAERSVEVDNDFRLSLSKGGIAVSHDQLSQGTRDQLYISMRVAAAELLGEGRSLPMFFDDSFGTTDSVRMHAIRSILEEMAKKRQFIILSHSQDIDGWGERIKVSHQSQGVL